MYRSSCSAWRDLTCSTSGLRGRRQDERDDRLARAVVERGMRAIDRKPAWRRDLPAVVAERITDAAEGNPLFVEEMLEMLIDDGRLEPSNGSWVAVGEMEEVAVPPSISSLLDARLDRLGPDERAVIERASVVGKVFYGGAIHA